MRENTRDKPAHRMGKYRFRCEVPVSQRIKHCSMCAEITAPAHAHCCEYRYCIPVQKSGFLECRNKPHGSSYRAESRNREGDEFRTLETEQPVEYKIDFLRKPRKKRHAFVCRPRILSGFTRTECQYHHCSRNHQHARYDCKAEFHACLAAIVWFVSNNIPDVSVRVAAMQTGIEATYPSYVPMDYSLSDIISEDGKLTMIFSGPDDARFTLVQEKSSWDSATLLRNYVEPTWGEEYVTTHEQGITIYISNQTNDSTWVNGGIRYSITSEGARLTKKQTRNIVLSL